MRDFFFNVFNYLRVLLLVLLVPLSGLAASAGQVKFVEAFDKSLGRLNTLERINEYIDSCAAAQKIPEFSEEEVFLVNDIIQRKFYHGYSYYSMNDNFLAYLAGEYVWDHLSAIVIPEDLLKHEMAACSQQAIVMMTVLKNRGYKVRKLGLKGHYILEVFYNNAWYIFDPNKEPLHQGVPHDSLRVFLENGYIHNSYSKTLSSEEVKRMFARLEVGEVNSVPAKNARLFHLVTKFVSRYFFFLITAFLGLIYFFKKRNQKSLITLGTGPGASQ